jgi:hypothetical protein
MFYILKDKHITAGSSEPSLWSCKRIVAYFKAFGLSFIVFIVVTVWAFGMLRLPIKLLLPREFDAHFAI